MKTNHSIATLLLLLSLGMTSCSTYYRMTSRIDTNGSMHREVYARGDSAFIAGNKTHNPFLFPLEIEKYSPFIRGIFRQAFTFSFSSSPQKLNLRVESRFTICQSVSN